MCTLTYYPTEDRIIVTSNRDEHPSRSKCELITESISGQQQLAYPKEPLKGGSWISVDNQGQIIVLLNGAFEKHPYRPNYGKSRGLILLEMARSNSAKEYLEKQELNQIEPFTIVCFNSKQFFEFRWTGIDKHWLDLDKNTPQIWSSATLYTEFHREKRKKKFDEFIAKNSVNEKQLWEFHTKASEDLVNGIVIKREEGASTISSTQMVLKNTGIDFMYQDHVDCVTKLIQWKNE